MMRFLLSLTFLCLSISPSFAADNSPMEKAKTDMEAGRYTKALSTLQELVNKEQDNYEAWFLFGVAQVHEQQDHQAIEAFRHVIELRPKLAEPHNNLAAVYNNLGDIKAAIKELEIALQKRPNYSVAEENLADLHIKLALQYYKSSLKHGANPTIEQRYTRLLNVRNPAVNHSETASVQPMVAKATPKTVVKPKARPVPITQPVVTAEAASIPMPMAQPSVVMTPVTSKTAAVSPYATTANPTVSASIAEDKSITGVLDALEAWRKAWSAQDLDQYFSAYSDEYKPADKFKNIEAWKAYKTRVIKNKTFINVQFERVEVDIPASRDIASVSILQHFRSNTYVGDDRKIITMKYSPQGWKIIAEATTP